MATAAQRRTGKSVAKDSAKAAKSTRQKSKKPTGKGGEASRKNYLNSSGASGKTVGGGTAIKTSKKQRATAKASQGIKSKAKPKSTGKATYKATGPGRTTYSRGTGMASGMMGPRTMAKKRI